ncbi:MAG: hypothetical protein C6I01_04010 [Epsilonproteobacteria bacterium]|jgi:hypothetical protein|nr:hypothetical protein [Campylobacterota bacterium]NPA89524.1 hypothetical protein [Campylobacterota bacterium]
MEFLKKVAKIGAILALIGGVGAGADTLPQTQNLSGATLNLTQPTAVSYLVVTNSKISFPPKSQISYLKAIDSQISADSSFIAYLEGVNSQIDLRNSTTSSLQLSGGKAKISGGTLSSISLTNGAEATISGANVASIVAGKGSKVILENVDWSSKAYTQYPPVHPRPGQLVLYPGAKVVIKGGNFQISGDKMVITFSNGKRGEVKISLLQNASTAQIESR